MSKKLLLIIAAFALALLVAPSFANAQTIQNLAAGKPVTGNFIPAPLNEPFSEVTDGRIDTNFYLADKDVPMGYVQIDLGQSYDLQVIKIWHYWNDGRTYYGNRVRLSNDPYFLNYVEVFSDTYPETAKGKMIAFSPTKARYIRNYLAGSNVDPYNHWVEIEAYTETPPARSVSLPLLSDKATKYLRFPYATYDYWNNIMPSPPAPRDWTLESFDDSTWESVVPVTGTYEGILRVPEATWVWAPITKGGDTVLFRRTLELPDGYQNLSAVLYSGIDDELAVYVNGRYLGWQLWNYNGLPAVYNLTPYLHPGKNVLAFQGLNHWPNLDNLLLNPAGLIFRLNVDYAPAPIPGLKVTGGGWILKNNQKSNFGFMVKYQKESTVPQGEFQYIDQATGLTVHSSSLKWLTVIGNLAIFEGTATVNGTGRHPFRVTITDKGTPDAGQDTFALTLDGSALAYGTLQGGNIVIH